jgi:superfamily II DNA or RNA helicase
LSSFKIVFTDRSEIKEKLRRLQFDNQEKFGLTLNAFDILSKLKKSKLSVIPSIKKNTSIELYDHQVYAALKVKNELGGSAILADEVGLGKTIEAGIIIKEFLISGLAKSVLILVPPSLMYQWQEELQEKFELDFIKQKDDKRFKDPSSHELLIMSHASAVVPDKSNMLKKRDWDMVIVDEAHSMKNSNTQKHRLLKALPRKFTLFLTATPIENNLQELYNLVELLKPGTFGTFSQFKNRYANDPQFRSINSFFKDELQNILSSIIIRTTRHQVKEKIKFTDRIAHTQILKPTEDERELYDKVTKIIQEKYEEGFPVFYLMIIQRLISSSNDAAKRALQIMKERELLDETEFNELHAIADRITIDTKAIALLDIIGVKKNEKFLIFTEWRSTQDYLFNLLKENGYSVTLFHGSLGLSERKESTEKFRSGTQIMISTSAGGYGQNFQFCSNIVNYDLPWNPMKVEQRIGRVHRINQKNDIDIYSVAYEKTIDAYILSLLYTKIELFKTALGHLDLIFGDISDESSQHNIFKEYISAKDEKEAEKKLSSIGDKWKNRKENLTNAVEEFNTDVFGNFSLSPITEVPKTTIIPVEDKIGSLDEPIKSLVLTYFYLINSQIKEDNELFNITLSNEHEKFFRDKELKITFNERKEETNYELVSPGSSILSRILNQCISFGPLVTAKLNSNEYNLPIIQFYFYVIFESVKSESQLYSVSVECDTQNIINIDDSDIDSNSNVSINDITPDTADDCYISAIDNIKSHFQQEIQDFKKEIHFQKESELQNINSEFKKRQDEINQKSQILRSKNASDSEFQNLLDENESIKREKEIVLKTLDKKYHVSIDFALISCRILH